MARRKTFPLRLDPELYDELRRWAEQELRSVNGQIEYVLRGEVERRRRAGAGRPGTSAGDERERRGRRR